MGMVTNLFCGRQIFAVGDGSTFFEGARCVRHVCGLVGLEAKQNPKPFERGPNL